MEEPDPVTTSASGSKPGIDATKKILGEGFTRPWPPLITMDATVVGKLLNQPKTT
jgi:4-hydroxy-3-polyprenylbenzoate decarboxylase